MAIFHTPAITFKFPESITLFVLQCFIILTKLVVREALRPLGILIKHNYPYSPLEDHQQDPASSPAALENVPIIASMEAIKKSVPVVEYGRFVRRSRAGLKNSGEVIHVDCSICLSSIEECHLIRELANCSHVFHQNCLDSWVDIGQVTCPLCRSMLLPIDSDRSMLC